MKKIKDIAQKETSEKLFLFQKENQNDELILAKEVDIKSEEHNCKECDNIQCKCDLILFKLTEVLDLSNQIGHTELYNIIITIIYALQNLHDDHESLNLLLDASKQTYTNIRPKEMGKMLN